MHLHIDPEQLRVILALLAEWIACLIVGDLVLSWVERKGKQ